VDVDPDQQGAEREEPDLVVVYGEHGTADGMNRRKRPVVPSRERNE
jgi:hypothetical protein